MEDVEQPQPIWKYNRDRASARTEAERGEHYEAWLTRFGQPYTDAVIDDGGSPWFASDDERRERWMRRYRKPAPPKLPGLSLDLIKIRRTEVWTPVETEIQEAA